MSGKPFTEEEIVLIRENYLKVPIIVLMNQLNKRSEGAIRAKANSLGMKKEYSTRKLTTDEKTWLQQNYFMASNEDLIRHFPDMSIKQIGKKACGLNLKRGTRIDFTKDEVELIKGNYHNMTAKALAILLPGRSPDTITNKAISLGLAKISKPPRKWQQEEVDWLVQFYEDSSQSDLRERFPNDDMRTITNKANALGLSRKVDNTLEWTLIDGKRVLTKKCASCRQRKPATEFYKSKRNDSGLGSDCKSCKWEQEKERRSCFDDERKDNNRLKGKMLKSESRRKYPEKSKESLRRSYQLHKEQRNEYQRNKYQEMPHYFKDINKRWREANHDRIKANNLNRKALKRSLPNFLSKEDLQSLAGDNGIKECALTGIIGDCHYCHFIPINWGHGGSYKANIFLGLSELNIAMRTSNPFSWFQIRALDNKINKDKVKALIARLASENGLGIQEFREFVYWCEQNKRSLEHVNADPRPSIQIWMEQRSLPTYSIVLPLWEF